MREVGLAWFILGTFVAVCHSAEVFATVGSYKRYLDEPAAFSSGVSVKIPVTRRIAVRPEFLADNGGAYSNLLALGSLTGDFTDPAKAAVGYWIAGGGLVRAREAAFALDARHWIVVGGAGVRFVLSKHWIAAAEFRAGVPAFPLVTFTLDIAGDLAEDVMILADGAATLGQRPNRV
ncbi:MAG TPA: hypothetical protein VEX68_27575 [Bryobacteraceae bacterium]|nr:hypothetical protein [Bryobacteraceae bacterium]